MCVTKDVIRSKPYPFSQTLEIFTSIWLNSAQTNMARSIYIQQCSLGLFLIKESHALWLERMHFSTNRKWAAFKLIWTNDRELIKCPVAAFWSADTVIQLNIFPMVIEKKERSSPVSPCQLVPQHNNIHSCSKRVTSAFSENLTLTESVEQLLLGAWNQRRLVISPLCIARRRTIADNPRRLKRIMLMKNIYIYTVTKQQSRSQSEWVMQVWTETSCV